MLIGVERNSHHVMLLPSLGHGHLIPFMHLANKLAATGLTITFVTTFHHLPSLRSTIHAAREAGLDIHLLQMDIPQDHLTMGRVNSNSVEWHHLPPILAANERLQDPFQNFLERFLQGKISPLLQPPVCVIADFLLGWSTEVTGRFGIPRVSFETSGTFGESIHQIVWEILPRNLPRTASGRYVVPGVPREVRLSRNQMPPELPEATTENETYQFWQRQRPRNKLSWRTISNTFYELEGEFVDHYERVTGPLRTIGPLLPAEAFDERPCRRIVPAVEMGLNMDAERCLQWLDEQEESSVLYISFGSENSISTAQIAELAFGLESSGVKFLWVLRIPSDVVLNSSSSPLDFLPEGIHGRLVEKKLGFFLLGWAPQLSILGHPATGGFLSHCGWNAVLEATTMGVAMITWPLYAEQHFNSKFVADEIQIGVEAPQRFEENWMVSRGDVEKVVRCLMEEEKGKEMRGKVRELKAAARAAVAEGGSSAKSFDLFVSEIMSLKSSF